MPGGGLPNQGPQQIVIPFVSNGWAVGALFVVHVLVVAFIMGTAWVLVFTGSMPLTPKNARFERFTHTMARWLEQTYSFGATFAVFAIAVLIGLFPRYFAVLTTVLGLPLILIFVAWLFQILTLLLYYFTWNRLRPRHRWAHQSLILVYAVAETVFIVMITLYTSYQLTPPQTPNLASALANPTWFPEALHRVAGNLSYSGFLIAAWGGWRYWHGRRVGTSVDKTYYHWVAHLGFLWAVAFELLQLPIGTYYVFAIQVAGPGTYTKMMLGGSTSAAWLLQIFLVASLFILGDIYMWASIRAAVAETARRQARQRLRHLGGPGQQVEEPPRQARLQRVSALWTGVGLWVLGGSGVLAILPDTIPVIGSMTAKWLALGIFLVWSGVGLVLYFLVSRGWTFGVMAHPALWSIVAAGVCVTILMVTMGVIRYTNPQTSVIERQMPLPAVRVQSLLTPSP
jgi:hypothetical protein